MRIRVTPVKRVVVGCVGRGYGSWGELQEGVVWVGGTGVGGSCRRRLCG
jgi:hypothetical protein